MPQIFQQPQQPTPATTEYISVIPETQMPASQVIQPAQQNKVAMKGHQQQQTRGQPTSFLVADNLQAGPSRPITITLTLAKHSTYHHLPLLQAMEVNTAYQDSQAPSEIFNLCRATNRLTHCSHFSPLDTQPLATSPPTTTAQQELQQPPA